MKKLSEHFAEQSCSTCNGTGFPMVAQPVPGRRIYPAPCEECRGKGRVTEVAN
jgi:DnaJ-class molecular chaperone